MKPQDKNPHIDYRQAGKEDCSRIAELDYIASAGAIEFLFHDLVPGLTAVQIIAANLQNDQSPHSYRNVIIAEHSGEIIGMALSFPAEYHQITKEMKDFFPAKRLEHFKHFFAARVEGSYFLDAICVDERFRNKGVGSKLINITKTRAKKQGFRVLSLIVFADNSNAVRLYRKNGFETVRNVDLQPHPLMPHAGGCLLMKADVSAG